MLKSEGGTNACGLLLAGSVQAVNVNEESTLVQAGVCDLVRDTEMRSVEAPQRRHYSAGNEQESASEWRHVSFK